MFSLLQIILSLNVSQAPTVNIITHFNSLEVCEIKLEKTLKRNITIMHLSMTILLLK